MPFDTPEISVRSADPRSRRLVASWLFALCGCILVMIVLGGATRLTGSGLSIMEWAPVSGALPPMNEAEWQRLFALYQKIPQYALVNQGFGLDGFKQIFWLEWAHRLWGRVIGLVFLVPLVVLVWRGAVSRTLVPRLVGLFLLGGLQGAVGWFMVASGFFPESTAVSPYRLVIHLVLALLLYAAILWTGLSVLRPLPAVNAPRHLRRLAGLVAGMVALTIVAGGFVAGLKAGLDYNTFPLMDGHLVPEGYARLQPLLRNLTENIAAVQFDHRLLASLTALATLCTFVVGWRAGIARSVLLLLGAAVTVQYALGVTTLLWGVPPGLATAHQATAVLVLTAALVLLHRLRGNPGLRSNSTESA
jgi:cytochrome c oxidase assembly protein subunit 15